jgi:hypothetical protein
MLLLLHQELLYELLHLLCQQWVQLLLLLLLLLQGGVYSVHRRSRGGLGLS